MRVAAIVMPELLAELGRPVRPSSFAGAAPERPLGVIVRREPAPKVASLDAVDALAHRLGARAGQSVAEASATVAAIDVREITPAAIDAALGRVAELALALAPTVAVAQDQDPALRSVVWLDTTGASHLVGGEAALARRLAEEALALGHRARVAIADGPRLARAVASFEPDPERRVVPAGQGAAALGELPLAALGLAPADAAFFARLGVATVRQLARLPRASLGSRLGEGAPALLGLIAGHDPTPLTPYVPPVIVREEADAPEGYAATEPLLFLLRGLGSRLAARLGARGQAAAQLELELRYDAGIARLEGIAPSVTFTLELPAPLVNAEDLLRPIRTKLEAVALTAPVIAIGLTASRVVRAQKTQLDLAHSTPRAGGARPGELGALIAELMAELGPHRVGVLGVLDAHRPEARSTLRPVLGEARGLPAALATPGVAPSRLLLAPVPIAKACPGARLQLGATAYLAEEVRFVMRLDAVEWWTQSPASRDYARVWLRAEGARTMSGQAGQALIFVDRRTHAFFLHGWDE